MLSSLEFHGRLNGIPVQLTVQRSSQNANWGDWASYFVSSGPHELLGRRLVASKRRGKDGKDTSGPMPEPDIGLSAALPGDRLFFADPDRAAILELATYDRLPDIAGGLAELLSHHRSTDEPGVEEEIVAPPDFKSAARFRSRLDLVPGEGDRLEAKLCRLREHPAAAECLRAAKADKRFSELLPLLEPWAPQIYNATRTAMMRTKTPAAIVPKKVPRFTIRINLMAIFLVLAIAAALVWSAMQPPASQVGVVDGLPLYSLHGDAMRADAM